MSWHRVLSIANKEVIQIQRDWRSLLLAIFTPFFMLVLFGFALSLDVDQVPMMIWDQNNTPESREFISRFLGSNYFSLKGYTDRYSEIERAIDNRDVILALVIPVDFASRLKSQKRIPVQLIVDGSDANTATLALGYADNIANTYSELLLINQVQRVGRGSVRPPIQLDIRAWFNANRQSTNIMIPSLIAVIMMVISALLTSLTIAREWERGTMEQLIATPVKTYELILGKLIPYFVIGMFDVLIIVVLGQWIFQVPMRGSFALLMAISIIFMLGSLALGILISIKAKSQLLASQLAMVLTFLPSFLLSGFITSLSNTPWPIQLISYAVPARYFITILKAIYLKGVGLSVLWLQVLLLTLYAIIMIIWAHTAFKKKLG